MVLLAAHTLLIIVALITALPNFAYGADKEPLIFYTWEDYIDPSIIEDWEAETGVPVKLVFYDDDAQRNLVLSSEESSQVDVTIVDNASMRVITGAGLLDRVPKSNHETYWPEACGEYGRPYLWGSYGIAYRSDKIDFPITSWRNLLNPDQRLKGHIGMLGQADELLITALAGMGYPINTANDTFLKQAFNLLKHQSHFVATYDYLYTYTLNNPEQDNIWIAPAYSGDQHGLNMIQGIDSWEFVVPEEGAIVWLDCISILESSNMKENALAFIEYLNRLDIGARNAEYLQTASPYKEVWTLISDKLRRDFSVYIGSETPSKTVPFEGVPGKEILKRTRIKDALLRYYDSN